MSDWRIPLSDLDYGPEEEEAALRVLRSRWLSMGPEVQTFEHEFGAFLGVRHAFAVGNATAGLHLAFLALEIGPGDEVIQPALNFVAAANMTVAAGATPVFADILSLDEPTIDPAHVERLITPKTKAVVVMHYGGYPCRMAELLALCRRHGLALIEDACHAVGARFDDARARPPDGRMAGSIGDVSAFSFFSNKNLATGEGGMVATDRDDLATRIRLLRSHGMTSLTWDREKGHASSYDVRLHGFNYRLDELHAAIGREQLRKLSAGNGRRGELVRGYRASLRNLPGLVLPFAQYAGDSAFHLMPVLAGSAESRVGIVAALKAAQIQTSLHYPCIPDFFAFARFHDAFLPNSREFARRIITLPLHPRLSDAAQEEVCACLRSAVPPAGAASSAPPCAC
jgi:dTDP-4-amino-4,6-dideoxygalactose transaminase